MARPHKVHGVFHHDPGEGLFLIVPEEVMPFDKTPKKELDEEQARFYRDAPFYDSTVEVRFDADRTVLASLASSGLATRQPPEWASAVIEVFLSGPQPFSLAVFVRRFAAHEQVARRAYAIHTGAPGNTPLENWLRAERELLGL